PPRGIYQVGAIELDSDTQEVRIAGRQVKPSPKPLAILTALMRAPSTVLSRSDLLDFVWGRGFAIGSHVLDVHVHALRKELNRKPGSSCKLVTVRKVGFKLEPPASFGLSQPNRPRQLSDADRRPSTGSLRRLSCNRILIHGSGFLAKHRTTLRLLRPPNGHPTTH
ncbi:MAG: winged helix-turn-helix domain-containing protein, partial [Nitrospira sp.]|nr:winged helix-turn-helix domain-containing protein [Nitrospira sp.]